MQLDILICRQCDHDSKFLRLRAKIVLRMVKRAREKPFFEWLSGRLGGQIEYLPVRPPETRFTRHCRAASRAPEASPLPWGRVGSRAQREIRESEYDADTTAPSPGSHRETRCSPTSPRRGEVKVGTRFRSRHGLRTAIHYGQPWVKPGSDDLSPPSPGHLSRQCRAAPKGA